MLGMAQPDKQLEQPGRRRRPRKGDEKEAAIIATAWRLLSQQSLSSITIDQLAGGAGISRPTFYFYFDSREAVIRALAAQVAEELRQQARPPVPPGGTAEQVVRQGVMSYLERWRKQGPILRAMVPLYEADQKLREFWDTISEEFIGEMANSIEAQRRLGRAKPAPPSSANLAHALAAMMWRAGYELSLDRPWTRDTDAMIDTLTTIQLRAIFA
jgi:AcrR family transcriptional regulator